MTTISPTPPTPPVPLPRPDETLSLDERILRAEHTLIAREERLRRGIVALGQRARAAAQPRRLLVPALGAVLAAVSIWFLWSRRRPSLATGTSGAASQGAAHARSHPPSANWASLFALAWPMVPARWRSKVSPATASTLVALGLPFLQRLVAPTPQPPLQTARSVELGRYAGTWYEVARLPAPFETLCDSQPMARYERRPDGLLDVVNHCPSGDGSARQAHGVARPVPGSNGARLQVSLWPVWLHWLPMAWADYWILDLDDDYQSALVGSPDRRFLWLLSRRPRLPLSRLQAMVDVARDRGFDVERLRFIG